MNNSGTLKDIMTTDLVVIKLDTSFGKIKEIFDNNKFHHLPVVDASAKLEGIISKSDFTKLAYQISNNTGGKTYSAKTYNHLTAKEIMRPHLISLSPDNRIDLAANLILENVYHSIPVVEDGKLVGIVTSHDLLAYAYYQPPVGKK